MGSIWSPRLLLPKPLVLISFLVACCGGGASQEAIGGVLVSPALSWSALSFRAQESEDTPTYFSYKPTFTLGVSIKQVWDLALYGEYAPLSRVKADYQAQQGEQLAYGFTTNWRIKDSFLFGFMIGPAKIMLKQDEKFEQDAGSWTGILYGVRLAAINKISKHHFWEAGITYSYLEISGKLNQETIKSTERADSVALYLSYVFNHQSSSFIEDSIFGSFLKSLTFL